MDQRIKSYVRPFRHRWALSQKELGFLIGGKSGTLVSRIEVATRIPSFAVALAFAAIFDTPIVDLFPVLHAEMQEALLRRATELYEELQGHPSKANRTKLDFLEALLARLQEKRPEV
jgi:DNA-binding XRE family transcriptional regulator